VASSQARRVTPRAMARIFALLSLLLATCFAKLAPVKQTSLRHNNRPPQSLCIGSSRKRR